MITVRRLLAAGAIAASAVGFTGCTSASEPDSEDAIETSTAAGDTPSGSAPIVFAFVCVAGSSDRTQTYTTYSAAWEDDRTDCTAHRITGTEMSAQQRAAVESAAGVATLEELAAGCAVRGVGPWADPVTSSAQADLGAGLLEYCPGHPDVDRLRDAIASWTG